MITISKSGTFKAKIYTKNLQLEELETYEQAKKCDKWKKVMKEDYNALIKNMSWNLVPVPRDKHIIGRKWTFRLKKNSNGTILKHKARHVVKGYTQQQGFDFTEIFSPMVKPTTIRIVLIIALHNNRKIGQQDMNNAFLNGEIHEEVYMEQPCDFKQGNSREMACKLNKAIYGLKHA